MRTLLPFAFLLIACPPSDDGETDTSADADTDSDTDADPDPMGILVGTVRDAGGEPVVGARVNFCRVICITVDTDASGAYTMEVDAWTGSFYVREPSALLDVIVPVTVTENETRAIDVTMVMASETVPFPTTPTEVEVAPGLLVTVSASAVEPPLFEELGDDISGALVDEAELLPLEIADDHGAFVAGYYLAPFEAVAADGLPFRIVNTFGLDAGAEVIAFAASGPDRYTWLPAGTLTVSGDGAMLDGGDLPILTTLVLFEVVDSK